MSNTYTYEDISELNLRVVSDPDPTKSDSYIYSAPDPNDASKDVYVYTGDVLEVVEASAPENDEFKVFFTSELGELKGTTPDNDNWSKDGSTLCYTVTHWVVGDEGDGVRFVVSVKINGDWKKADPNFKIVRSKPS